VLTDDQLIDEVRRALLADTAGIAPRPSTLDRVRRELAVSRRPGWLRRPGVRADAVVIAVATGIAVAIALIATVFLHHRSSSGNRTNQVPTMNQVAVGTARLTAQAADPSGGLRWGLRIIQTRPREGCLQIGRVKDGTIGTLGQDGAYSNDGRFHPIPSRESFPCAGTDANNYLFLNVLEQDVPASGPSIHGHGGCTGSAAPDLPSCGAQDLRDIAFGMLGPEAVSVTYLLRGRSVTEPTGPDGAYIAVLPGTSRLCFGGGGCGIGGGEATTGTVHAGVITSVRYRDGSVCRLATQGQLSSRSAAPTQSAPNTGTVPGVVTGPYTGTPAGAVASSCPALGYTPIRYHEPHPTAGQVAAPMTVQILKAEHYCYKPLAVGSFLAPCDHGRPQGYKPASPQPRLALVNITFTARVAADNRHSVYEYSYGRASGPANCTLNTGGTSATTMRPIRAGQRVTLQDDAEVCPGTYAGIVTYQPNGAPGHDTLDFSRPIHDHSTLVGRFTYRLRK
jgi:hypothetical protein